MKMLIMTRRTSALNSPPNTNLQELSFIAAKHQEVTTIATFFIGKTFFKLNIFFLIKKIIFRNEKGQEQWYKFDDGEVSECKIHEDEELKAQCFGGDYMGEVYDNNLKRMQFRRQKRWWNAYMLFYTRTDYVQAPCSPSVEQLSLTESKNGIVAMPEPIERSLRLQNVRFLHSRSLYSIEFFNFVRNLVSCSIPPNKFEKVVRKIILI
jgi:hypothetical protein